MWCWWIVTFLNAFPIKAALRSIVFTCLYESHGQYQSGLHVNRSGNSFECSEFQRHCFAPGGSRTPSTLRSAKLLDCDTFYCAVTVAEHALFVQFQGLGSMRLAGKWAFQFSTQSPLSGNVHLSNKFSKLYINPQCLTLLQALAVPHGEFQTCMPRYAQVGYTPVGILGGKPKLSPPASNLLPQLLRRASSPPVGAGNSGATALATERNCP